MIDFKLQQCFTEFLKQYDRELTKAEVRAMVSTFNEIVKYTLPNTPNTVPSDKRLSKNPNLNYNKAAATKVIPEMKDNLKKLRSRIKHDIIGDGKLNSGIPTAFAVSNGKIAKDTLKGKVYASYVVRRKSKAKKNQKYKMPPNITSSSSELLNHILKTTKMRKSKSVGFRTKTKGTSIIWIESANVAKDAANQLMRSAGSLLYGWKALESKVMSMRDSNGATILDKILKDTNETNRGMGRVSTNADRVIMVAENPNVSRYDEPYQQRVVEDNIRKNFAKHLEREIGYINTDRIRKGIKEKL